MLDRSAYSPDLVFNSTFNSRGMYSALLLPVLFVNCLHCSFGRESLDLPSILFRRCMEGVSFFSSLGKRKAATHRPHSWGNPARREAAFEHWATETDS